MPALCHKQGSHSYLKMKSPTLSDHIWNFFVTVPNRIQNYSVTHFTTWTYSNKLNNVTIKRGFYTKKTFPDHQQNFLFFPDLPWLSTSVGTLTSTKEAFSVFHIQIRLRHKSPHLRAWRTNVTTRNFHLKVVVFLAAEGGVILRLNAS